MWLHNHHDILCMRCHNHVLPPTGDAGDEEYVRRGDVERL